LDLSEEGPMAEPLVRYTKQDGIAVLELNNPLANCYTYELMREADAEVHGYVRPGYVPGASGNPRYA